MKIKRGLDHPTEMLLSYDLRSAKPISLSAHYLKPIFNRRKRFDTVLELIARLAVRAALKQHKDKHVVYSLLSTDNAGAALTSAESNPKFRP